MTILASHIGTDVSKDSLDFLERGKKLFRVENNCQGIYSAMNRLPSSSTIVLERSGGYERLAVKLFRENGFTVLALNPCSVRRFALAVGRKAKTDALDAEILSRAGEILPAPVEKSQEREALSDHSRHIQDLKSELANAKKRIQKPGCAGLVIESLERQISFLTSEIQLLEKQFLDEVKKGGSSSRYELALSVPSVGPVTARVVVCELSEDLSNLTPGQIASYAGLAPMDNSSGRRTGERHVRRGNVHLKSALYMAALNSVRRQEWSKEIYARLKARGASHQSAMVVVMRRLLIRIVAVLQRGTPWEDVPLK